MKIVNTNLGGGKSSRNIAQTVSIQTSQPLFSSTITYTVHIQRKHVGTGVWPDQNNLNYMEIYLPADAKIVTLPQGIGGQSQLAAVDQQAMGTVGKKWSTVVTPGNGWEKVGFWATTNVHQETDYTLVYSLPVSSNSPGLLYIKQAGAEKDTVKMGSFDGLITGDTFLAN